MKLSKDLDGSGYQLLNVRLSNLASNPGTLTKGLIWLLTSTNRVYFYDGTTVYALRDEKTTLVNSDIDAAAAIALSKLAVDPLARANHTGTQLAATISNFDTAVRTSRLDQMAAPTGPVALNSQRITGLADPSGAQDAATKNYVDGVASGLDVKASVRLATAAALPAHTGTGTPRVLTASANGALTIDGVAVAAADRVLVKDEGAGTHLDNGVYVVTATGGAGAPWVLTRAGDADTSAEVTPGLFTFVEAGTANQDNGYVLTTDGPITLDTTALTFQQFSGAGQITAGAGLSKTGNTLDVNVDGSTLEINADTLRVKDLGITNAKIAAATIDLTAKVTGSLPVANGGTSGTTAATARSGIGATGKSSATFGDGSAVNINFVHNLNSTDVHAMVKIVSTGEQELADWIVVDANTIQLQYGAAPALNTRRVTVIG